MKKFKEYRETTNRTVYNRRHKENIANKDGLCTFCYFHRGENGDGYQGSNPSWKMISKYPKQYQKVKKISRQVDKRKFFKSLCWCFN